MSNLSKAEAPRTSILARWRLRRERRKLCVWCHGTRIFHPQLPLTCPVCEGTGKRR